MSIHPSDDSEISFTPQLFQRVYVTKKQTLEALNFLYPKQKQRMEMPGGATSGLISDDRISVKHLPASALMPSLYDNLPEEASNTTLPISSAMASRLGIALPNPAPDVDYLTPPVAAPLPAANAPKDSEPKKKKYAKEAWPGKKPVPAMLL